MNCSPTGAPRVAQVRITAPELCEVHGWIAGGQQIYIQSSTFNRAVEVFDTQYELLEQDKTGPDGLANKMAIRKHRKTTDPELTISERLDLVIGNVLGIHVEDIHTAKRLEDDYSVDEIDRLDLISSLESEFDITIIDQDFNQLSTVGDVLDYLTARVGTQG